MANPEQVDPSKKTQVEMHSEPRNTTDGARSDAAKATSSSMNDPHALPNNDSDQQQEPFHIVLVDIKNAANYRICCVEKLLADKDMKFMALSYRWGEVQEQVVDTGLGYVASITSFHLDDFYSLCENILQEPDLRSMEYVWVDAICIDQNNRERRKATIYQMSNIYERANYILAVPDLHLRYLKQVHSADEDTIRNVAKYAQYIYNLIHGKVDNLIQDHEEWFDIKGIPQNSTARQEIAEYKSYFMDYLGEYNKHIAAFNVPPERTPDDVLRVIDVKQMHKLGEDRKFDGSIQCPLCNYECCTCELERTLSSANEFNSYEQLHSLLKGIKDNRWHRQILERRKDFTQAMEFLVGLIRDWSSRVWVISEFHIAKNKRSRKLKYWFMSLASMNKKYWYTSVSAMNHTISLDQLGFFVFDFDHTATPIQESWVTLFEKHFDNDIFVVDDIWAYDYFHTAMRFLLNQQSFVEMMLKSRASRNEDRFYAILPNSNYKHLLKNKHVVDSWHIDNIISVKLKLYEFMSTKDKLLLLFATAQLSFERTFHLPLFASINMYWRYTDVFSLSNHDTLEYNFDLENDAALQLIHPNASDDNPNGTPRYKLNLRPNMFYIASLQSCVQMNMVNMAKDRSDPSYSVSRLVIGVYKSLLESLDVGWDNRKIKMVYIPMCVDKLKTGVPKVCLLGSLDERKWLILTYQQGFLSTIGMKWEAQYDNNGHTSFDIY